MLMPEVSSFGSVSCLWSCPHNLAGVLPLRSLELLPGVPISPSEMMLWTALWFCMLHNQSPFQPNPIIAPDSLHKLDQYSQPPCSHGKLIGQLVVSHTLTVFNNWLLDKGMNVILSKSYGVPTPDLINFMSSWISTTGYLIFCFLFLFKDSHTVKWLLTSWEKMIIHIRVDTKKFLIVKTLDSKSSHRWLWSQIVYYRDHFPSDFE